MSVRITVVFDVGNYKRWRSGHVGWCFELILCWLCFDVKILGLIILSLKSSDR